MATGVTHSSFVFLIKIKTRLDQSPGLDGGYRLNISFSDSKIIPGTSIDENDVSHSFTRPKILKIVSMNLLHLQSSLRLHKEMLQLS